MQIFACFFIDMRKKISHLPLVGLYITFCVTHSLLMQKRFIQYSKFAVSMESKFPECKGFPDEGKIFCKYFKNGVNYLQNYASPPPEILQLFGDNIQKHCLLGIFPKTIREIPRELLLESVKKLQFLKTQGLSVFPGKTAEERYKGVLRLMANTLTALGSFGFSQGFFFDLLEENGDKNHPAFTEFKAHLKKLLDSKTLDIPLKIKRPSNKIESYLLDTDFRALNDALNTLTSIFLRTETALAYLETNELKKEMSNIFQKLKDEKDPVHFSELLLRALDPSSNDDCEFQALRIPEWVKLIRTTQSFEELSYINQIELKLKWLFYRKSYTDLFDILY